MAFLGLSAVVAESLHHAALAVGVVFAGGATARRAIRHRHGSVLIFVCLAMVAALYGHVSVQSHLEMLGAVGLVAATIAERRYERARPLTEEPS